MKKLKKSFKLWWPVIVWCGLIFYGSSIPSPEPTQTFIDFILHKLFHLFEYGVLFALVFRTKQSFWPAIVFVILYAFSDEIHQSFVPTRTASLRDVFIDIIGGLIGWQFIKLIQLKKPKLLVKK